MSATLPSVYRGDTMPSMTLLVSFKDDEDNILPPPGNFVSARLQFRRKLTALTSEILATAQVDFEIDGQSWKFITRPLIISSTYFGLVHWDLEVTYTDISLNTYIQTYFPQSTIQILEDITQ